MDAPYYNGPPGSRWCDDPWPSVDNDEYDEPGRQRSVCPDCGGGWTFDFQQKRVYCRTCEESK